MLVLEGEFFLMSSHKVMVKFKVDIKYLKNFGSAL